MEPFKLTLQQVTFKEGEENPNEFVGSFDAVINCNYDSKGTDENKEEKSTTSSYHYDFQNVKYTTCSLDFTTHAVGIQVPNSGLDKKTEWYNYLETPPPESIDDFVVNADVNFTQANKPQPSVTDISTIAQISSNSLAANQLLPYQKPISLRKSRTLVTTSLKTVMPSETEQQTPEDGRSPKTPVADTSFDTVAEALHLQRTVIGNSKLTPAPPDVVAQIVAEAERKMRMESESNGSVSSLSDVSSLNSEQTSTVQNYDIVVDQSNTSLNLSDNSFSEKIPIPEISTSASVELPKTKQQLSDRELIRIPAQKLSITKEKGGARDKVERNQVAVKGKETLQTEKVIRDKITTKKTAEQDSPEKTRTLTQKTSPAFDQSVHPATEEEEIIEVNDDTSRVPQREDSGIGLDKPYSSTPSGKPSPKPEFVLPPLDPLFTTTPKPALPSSVTPAQLHQFTANTDGSLAMRRQLDIVLKEKARLEGQLEVLTMESNSNLQERAELQAQLASLKLKLLSKMKPEADDKKAALKADLEEMRQSKQLLEDSVISTQRQLEDKAQESKILNEELQVTQDAMDKLHIKMKELRDTLSAKEMTIQALKNKIAELYVEVQNTLQSKSEADADAAISKSDLTALINAKEWYQQQLQLAHEVRCSLQKELTILQAQSVSQCSIVERLKLDNTKLRKQLTESQQKALREKELLAKHLEAIQTDMMDREAAFMEMQSEKKLLEDSFNSQCKTVENEHSRLSYLMQATTDLESQLEKAQADAKKKQIHILNLENNQIDLEKKLTLSQEKINEKDGIMEEMNRKMIEVDSQLKAFQNSIMTKDSEILKLKEEKASAEIALSGALKEKEAVDSALDTLKCNMGKVEKNFKQMRQELSSKVHQLEEVKTEKNEYHVELEKARKELEIKRRSYDTIHKDYNEKTSALNNIQIEKSQLESQICILKKEISEIVEVGQQKSKEQSTKETALQNELEETKSRLQIVQKQLQEEMARKEEAHLVQHSDKGYDLMDKEIQATDSVENNVEGKELSMEYLNQEQQTDMTVTQMAELERSKNLLIDTAANTEHVEQREIQIQTVDEPKLETTDLGMNTVNVQVVHADNQTEEIMKPSKEYEDVSMNTDRMESRDIQSQTKPVSSVDISTQSSNESQPSPKSESETVSVSTETVQQKHCHSQTDQEKHTISENSVQSFIESFAQTVEQEQKPTCEDSSMNTIILEYRDIPSQTTAIEKVSSEDFSVQASLGIEPEEKASAKESTTQTADYRETNSVVEKVCNVQTEDSSMNTDVLELIDSIDQTDTVVVKENSAQATVNVSVNDAQTIEQNEISEGRESQKVVLESSTQTDVDQDKLIASAVANVSCEDASAGTERSEQLDNESQTVDIEKQVTIGTSSQTDESLYTKSPNVDSFPQTYRSDTIPLSHKSQSSETYIDTCEAGMQTDILKDFVNGQDELVIDEKKMQASEVNTKTLSVQESTCEANIHKNQFQFVDQQQNVIIEGVSKVKYDELLSEKSSLHSKVSQLEENLVFQRTESKEIISKLNDSLIVVQDELDNKQLSFSEKVEALSQQLNESLAKNQELQTELQVQRENKEKSTADNGILESKIKTLEDEIRVSEIKIKELENSLVILQESKDSEIIQLKKRLGSVEEELEKSRENEKEAVIAEEMNQKLALELEKERGRLEGLIQNNTSLKQHVGQLEEALARRESTLVELQNHLIDSNKDKALTSEDYIKRVQTLESTLQKEKESQRDLRKQIGVKITENKKLKKQQEEFKREQESMKHQVELHEKEVIKLQTELENNRQSSVSHQTEIQTLQSEKKSLQVELEHVQRELADNMARNPVIQEQMETLQWQISQKNKEVEFAQEQVKLVEQRQDAEIDLLRQTIKEKQTEIEDLQKELASAKQEKINQKTRVSELRSALKSSVQYHKLAKKMNSKKQKLKQLEEDANSTVEEDQSFDNESKDVEGETESDITNSSVMVEKGVQVDLEVEAMVLPSPTYDLDAIETLLEKTAIQTLENKPLDNLQSCLISLKSQINGLQLSMEVHTTNIHNSNQTADDLEKEVHELQQVVRTVANTTFASLTTETACISTEGTQGE